VRNAIRYRGAGALTLFLVAEIDERVVGHVAFSPVTISDATNTKDWYGLNEGLSFLKQLRGANCAFVGDSNYYIRFGFKNFPELIYEGVPQEFFLALPFSEKIPQGIVIFHEGFMADS